MKAIVVAALVVAHAAGSILAGPLDLYVYPGMNAPEAARERPAVAASAGLWRPGTPLAARGESPGIVAFSHGGYAALGAMGLAGSLSALGRDPFAARNAVGFGIIAAIHLWGGWRSMSGPRREDSR